MSATAKTSGFKVAYLGPEGSFSHLVAKKRYPEKKGGLIPFGSVPEVFEYLQRNKTGKGIVPIENSSGGMIIPTIDGLIENACTLFIEEELSIDVKLALMSKKGRKIKTVYSHFAPLYHCEPFLKQKYPKAVTSPCTSTANAAKAAVEDETGAVIGPIDQADLFGLEVLAYPIRDEVRNVTQFFVLSHHRRPAKDGEKTSVVVALPDYPGSLFDFLRPLADAKVNLKRIESRPVVGEPNTYKFLIEFNGTESDPRVAEAMRLAEKASAQFYNVGSYPVLPQFSS